MRISRIHFSLIFHEQDIAEATSYLVQDNAGKTKSSKYYKAK